MTNRKDFGPKFYLHILILIIAYTSPFWLPYWWIIGGILLYWLQIAVFQGCVLTQAEFGSKDESFWVYYLGKIGVQLPAKYSNLIIDLVFPMVILTIALLYQLIIKPTFLG